MRGNLSKLVCLLVLSAFVKCEDNLNFIPAVSVEVEPIPRVVIPLLIRNKAHNLPYFFSYLENLDYPKDKISLWIRSDHNEDDSIKITKLWLNRVEKLYHNVNFAYDETERTFNLSTNRVDWSDDRFSHIIALKEEALDFARNSWADYIFFCDVDVFLINPKTLTELINLKLPIVAPMLLSANLVYSNFWAATTNYYYGRAAEYFEIVQYKKIGEFNVPMVHSAVLVNLNYEPTKMLTFDKTKLIQRQLENNLLEVDYHVPFDDIIVFAISAKSFNIPLAISNSDIYGFFSIPASESYEEELENFLDMKIIILTKTEEDLLVNEEFKHLITYPKRHKLTFDNIYMINLERRPERRLKMERLLRELGLEYEYFEAVDGKKLSPSIVAEMGIKYLEGYEDPYHARQMKLGEVGCFLSHYRIWEQMIERGEKEVLVLEDDVRFDTKFVKNSLKTLKQVRESTNWDFLYFGRKILESNKEFSVKGTENIISVEYSYWTVGYAITLEGAKKLVNANPMKSLIPVDEYIPVMYDRHPNDTWSNAFPNRNLIAYSADPLLLYPQLYIGDSGYISDTENSIIINPAENTNDTSTIEVSSHGGQEVLGKSMIKEKIEL